VSIYLGSRGQISLKRKFGENALYSTVNTVDVNVTKKRFSFDFDDGTLLTGDQVEISSTDGSNLTFVAAAGWANSTQQSSGKWFVHIDSMNGVRIYASYANAINGGSANAIATATPGSAIPIKVTVENAVHRILAQVASYELSTQTDTYDITSLSDQFRSQYSGLMSGSGRITCAYDYRDTVSGASTYEVPHYLLQLVLRTQVGSEFSARFFLKTDGYSPSGAAGTSDDELFYEFNGVITSAAVQFSPGTSVDISANFLATGPIQLKMDVDAADSAALQEDSDDILLEDTSKLLLED
jgi:hypothetical protein